MEFSNLKKDKGVAGLTILLSVVVMLFVIGLLVMIFSIMGDELNEATEETTSGSAQHHGASTVLTNESAVLFVNTTIRAYEDIACSLINLTNHTTGTLIGSGNYTVSGTGSCYVTLNNGTAWSGSFNGTTTNATFTFTHSTDTTASGVIENSTSALEGAVDWFDIFIVITAMVVLILLTVIIITAIRGSGLIGGGGTAGGMRGGSGKGFKPKNFGSA